MNYIRKHGFTILVSVLLILLFIPQTSLPIKVFFQRMFMTGPGMLAESERISIGDYSWFLTDMEGTTVNFNESEDKVILLNFWATWCPPCVAELPEIQALYNDYGSKVDFYLVTMEEPEIISRFMEKKGYDLPVYIQKFKAPDELEVQTIPTTFLIDSNGTILIEKTGAADWNSEKFRDQLDLLLP